MKELQERIAREGYTEWKEDVLALSQLAEDLRDVLLKYQVSKDPESRCSPSNTETGVLEQLSQQQAVYDQNRRLIVSFRIST